MRHLPQTQALGVTLLVGFVGLMLSGCGASSSSEANTAPQEQPAATPAPEAGAPAKRVQGQMLYVPSYPRIYIRNEERTMSLAATLSIRNVSPSDSMTVTRVDYFDSGGELVRRYLEEPLTLSPLQSTSYVVGVGQAEGDAGASFLVTWSADRPTFAPLVEAVHVTTQMSLGISFTSQARVLYEEP